MSQKSGTDGLSRPTLAPAIVSGSCAVAVALITGAFNWLSQPVREPLPPGPPLSVQQQMLLPQATASESNTRLAGPASFVDPIRTAAVDQSAPVAAPDLAAGARSAHLNFAAFQATVKDPAALPQVRQSALDRCLGQTVIWQGYVDEVVPMPAASEFAWTIVLCEDRLSLDQSAFKMPALCRFTGDPDGRVEGLVRGQRVTITGLCKSHSALGSIVVDCRLGAVSAAPR